jgi:hypothetical protein
MGMTPDKKKHMTIFFICSSHTQNIRNGRACLLVRRPPPRSAIAIASAHPTCFSFRRAPPRPNRANPNLFRFWKLSPLCILKSQSLKPESLLQSISVISMIVSIIAVKHDCRNDTSLLVSESTPKSISCKVVSR